MAPNPGRPSRAARVVVGGLRARPGDGWTSRAVARALLTVVALLALLWILWSTRSVILWVAVAAFLAVAINPAVGSLTKRLRLPRSGAIGVVYLLGLAAFGGLMLVFIPPLIDAGDGLVTAIPGYVDRLQNSQFVQDLDREYGVLDQIKARATDAVSGVAGPNTAVDAASRVVNGLVALISIGVMCFLFSLYGPALRRWTEAQFDEEGARGRVHGVLEGVYKVIAGYVVGVFLVALLGATAAAVFMNAAGIPYWPVLALWVALMALIPLVGAALGAAPYIIVAFFQGWPIGVAAIVFFVIYQQIENNVVQPNIHRRTVNLNPLWIIIAVLMGTQLLGIVGALVAIPVAGIVQVLVTDWARHRGEDDDPLDGATVVPVVPAPGPEGPGTP